MLENILQRAEFHHTAHIHHTHLVCHLGHKAHVVRDQDNGLMVVDLQGLHQLHDLRLDRHIQSSRRLIRDDNVRIADHRNGNHNTLLHAAGKLVRIVVHAAYRIGNAQLFEHIQHMRPRLGFFHAGVLYQSLCHLIPYLIHGVQRGHRVLEHHPDLRTTQTAHIGAIRLHLVQPVLPAVLCRTIDHMLRFYNGIFRHQLYNGMHRHAFAAAGFAYDGQGRAAAQPQRDILDDTHFFPVGDKAGI